MIRIKSATLAAATVLGLLATATPAQARAPVQARGADAVAIVQSYFNAINDHDYRTAWDLGGKNFSGSYGSFVAGFDNTLYDALTIEGSHGDVVDVFLDAEQYNGSDHEYSGSYTVRGGQIVAAHLTRR